MRVFMQQVDRAEALEPVALATADPVIRQMVGELQAVALEVRRAERDLDAAVARVREAGMSWRLVSLATGLTTEGARRKWGAT